MSTILIVLLLVIGVILAASVALGRVTFEVESAPDTEYLELEGTWVRYNVIGGGPPVLLVHGWLSSSRIWEQLAGRLAQRFTVYTLDLSGFGESDKPLSGYGVRNGSRLLYAFCAHFGLTRTNVVGHDLGGNMAVKLAADHPDVVGRLVLVATPADENQIDLPTSLWLATLPVLGPIFYTLGRLARPVRGLWMRPFVADPQDLTEEVV
ncbi:MAG TPA: alpha/beta hydrolase, partial [Rubrobacteraceae bacterium]|nr:alpha/beta hydrolase [Rubrobacteraceae bacterium]